MAQFQIFLGICLLCSLVSAQNRNLFMQKAALKGDSFMQNMPMIQQKNSITQPQIRSNQSPFGLRINSRTTSNIQPVLPPQQPQVNPSQQIIHQIEQMMKIQNKTKPTEISTTTRKSVPQIQNVNPKDNNFKIQTRPQVQPTPQIAPPTPQKPQFINTNPESTVVTSTPVHVVHQTTKPSHPTHHNVKSNVRVAQNLPVEKRQEVQNSVEQTTTLATQQHLDSFHESSEVLKQQSLQIEQILEEEKQRQQEQQQQQQQQLELEKQKQLDLQKQEVQQQQQQKQQKSELLHKQASFIQQNVDNLSEPEKFLSYPNDYYKKYLDYEPCMSSPCPFGRKCVNKNDFRGYECLAPEPQVGQARQLSGNARKLNGRYQKFENSNEKNDVYEMIRGLVALNELELKLNQSRQQEEQFNKRTSNLVKPQFTTNLQEEPVQTHTNANTLIQRTITTQLECPECPPSNLNEFFTKLFPNIKEIRVKVDVV